MSTDANLHRLPDIVIFYPKFLVPLAGIIQLPYPTDSSDIRLKQRKDSFYARKHAPKNFRHFISIKSQYPLNMQNLKRILYLFFNHP